MQTIGRKIKTKSKSHCSQRPYQKSPAHKVAEIPLSVIVNNITCTDSSQTDNTQAKSDKLQHI